ncbi:MAG: hypothetical protein WCO72_08740, partial [Betaproteobacteria bacterium]
MENTNHKATDLTKGVKSIFFDFFLYCGYLHHFIFRKKQKGFWHRIKKSFQNKCFNLFFSLGITKL